MPANLLVFGLEATLTDLYVFDKDALTFTKVTTQAGLVYANNGNETYVSLVQAQTPNDQAWYSDDDGATWQDEVAGNASAYAVRWDKWGALFHAVSYDPSGFFQSTDGLTWTSPAAAPSDADGFLDLIVIDGNLYTIDLRLDGGNIAGDNIWLKTAAGAWTNTLVQATTLTGGSYGGNSLTTFIPRGLATNRVLILATSANVNEACWATYNTDAVPSAFTGCTHTGTGALRCAVAGGSFWLGGGDETWSHSADGKAWTHVAGEPEIAGWMLNDCLWDGELFWWTGSETGGGGTTAAIFSYDPTPTYDAGTWTRYDVTGAPGAGAWALTGFPSYWDFVPWQTEVAPVSVFAEDVQAPNYVEAAVVNVVADAAAHIAQVEGPAVVNVYADDAFPNLIRVAIVEEWIEPGG